MTGNVIPVDFAEKEETFVRVTSLLISQSSSRDDVTHYTFWVDDDIYCTCEGFRYGGECKHVDRFYELLEKAES